MVATLRIRQQQKDVNEAEEAELRRLENGATAGVATATDQLRRRRAVVTVVAMSGKVHRRMAVLAWSWPAQSSALGSAQSSSTRRSSSKAASATATRSPASSREEAPD